MSEKKRPRLADTMRKPNASPARPVAEVLDDGSEKLDRRTTIYLSSSTWKALKLRAVEEETNASQIIEELLKEHLAT
ncbi:hypothetical protein ACTXPP_12790 [Candidatus Corynebacterium faecigallinarum]|uniref:hypothetical protein n=1 Tax=Candidatus Corynebacterium faecigallinarum TaxID=2838528 RepID=UPI003FD454B6